jgi:hypothetical protein
MPCERKSVEPMVAITAPHRTAVQHQSLLHFIGEGKWSDEKVLAKVREMVVPQMQRHGAIEAWIIDDTGFPKQGQHSVGVARQYCGQLEIRSREIPAGNGIGRHGKPAKVLKIGSAMETANSKNASTNDMNHPESMPMLRCPSRSPDLCGGRSAMSVRTHTAREASGEACSSRITLPRRLAAKRHRSNSVPASAVPRSPLHPA